MGTTEEGGPAHSGAPSLRSLFAVIFHKHLILLARYPVNTASMFVTLICFFGIIFYGGRAVAGPALTDSLAGIIVGLFLYTLSMTAYSGLARTVTREAEWGTLERLFISPHGFGTIMAAHSAVNVCLSFVWGFAILLVMMTMSGRWLTVDPLTVVPFAFVTLLSVLGVGFFFAGLALVYKRIENVFQLVQFAFIGLIAAPVQEFALLRLLPLSQGSYLTRNAMENGTRLWEFPAPELGVLVATNALYLALGYYCFHRAVQKARAEGLLGHY